MEESIRNGSPKPVQKILDYDLENHSDRFLDEGLLRRVENAEPFIGESPHYQKWDAERHR